MPSSAAKTHGQGFTSRRRPEIAARPCCTSIRLPGVICHPNRPRPDRASCPRPERMRHCLQSARRSSLGRLLPRKSTRLRALSRCLAEGGWLHSPAYASAMAPRLLATAGPAVMRQRRWAAAALDVDLACRLVEGRESRIRPRPPARTMRYHPPPTQPLEGCEAAPRPRRYASGQSRHSRRWCTGCRATSAGGVNRCTRRVWRRIGHV